MKNIFLIAILILLTLVNFHCSSEINNANPATIDPPPKVITPVLVKKEKKSQSIEDTDTLINRLLPSAVRILRTEGKTSGSGVLYKQQNTLFVLTNDHVCSSLTPTNYIIKNDVTGFIGEAEFYKTSPKLDICALKIKTYSGTFYSPKINKFTQGKFETVITFGNSRPHHLLRVDIGMHIGSAQFSTGPGEIYNFCVDYGYSGGPVYNRKGELVALINAKNVDESDVCESYGVSSEGLYNFILDL